MASPQVRPVAQFGRLTNEIVLFEDASERIIPTMGDQAAALELRAMLVEFAEAYDAGDDAKARRSLVAARKVIVHLGESEHPANLSALRLSLLQAETLLIGAEESHPPDS